MMKKNYKPIKQWLLNTGKSITEFAVHIGVSRPYLSLVLNEKMIPSKHLDKAIWATYKELKENYWN